MIKGMVFCLIIICLILWWEDVCNVLAWYWGECTW